MIERDYIPKPGDRFRASTNAVCELRYYDEETDCWVVRWDNARPHLLVYGGEHARGYWTKIEDILPELPDRIFFVYSRVSRSGEGWRLQTILRNPEVIREYIAPHMREDQVRREYRVRELFLDFVNTKEDVIEYDPERWLQRDTVFIEN